MKKRRKHYSEKNPAKLSWLMSEKSDNFFFILKEKRNTKLPWPMSAKSDTSLPGFIYKKIRIFLDCL